MASAKSIKLDANGDVDFSSGGLLFVTRAARAKQKLRIRLSTFLTEWFLDERVGVPWVQTVFQKNADPNVVRQVLRECILGTPEVATLDVLNLNVDPSTRVLSGDFQCTLDDGTVITLELNEPILASEISP